MAFFIAQKHGGAKMENERKKSDCPLIGQDGNVGYTDTNKAFVERDLRGVEAMSETVSELDIWAREEIEQELKMQ